MEIDPTVVAVAVAVMDPVLAFKPLALISQEERNQNRTNKEINLLRRSLVRDFVLIYKKSQQETFSGR